MCLVVYLASACALTHREYDPSDETPFLTDPGRDRLRRVRSRLSLPFVYRVGSSKGCSCGFLTDGEVGPELERVRAEYAALGEFVSLALEEAPEAELFSSWEGEERDEPVERVDVTDAELDRIEFKYDRRHFVRVRRSGSLPFSTSGP